MTINPTGGFFPPYKMKNETILTDKQKDILVGVLLGDATFGLRTGKPVYALKIEQAIVRKVYAQHLLDVFRNVTNGDLYYRFTDRQQQNQAAGFRTQRDSCFVEYFNKFTKLYSEVNPKNPGQAGKLRSKKTVPPSGYC